jgi:CRP-like cAMP-binding protein
MVTRSMLDSALLAGWFAAGLPDGVRGRLAELAVLTSHATGAVLIREGTPVDALGIIVDGRVAIRLSVPGRGVTTVLTVEPGDCIGWSAIVPPYRATSTVVALEPTTVLSFDGPALRATLEAEPALAAVVQRRVLEAVGRRLQATRTQLLDLFARTDGGTW